jgi:hypothetical protein
MTDRRNFLARSSGAAIAAPMIVKSSVFGANDRINLAGIGMGNQGRGDLGAAIGFKEIQCVAVCDVVRKHAEEAKAKVDARNKSNDCKIYSDFREVIARDDIDAVLIGTPDHWHALIAIAAMQSGKDVYCEKPETLTVREGREMLDTARRFGRVFSGGSQRVWGDYNWYHHMLWGGAIGEVQEGWVSVGGPSGECYLDPHPVPEGVDWDMWLGPAPWRPFHPQLIRGGFRPFRDYSGGGMTDWGCHTFGGAMYAMQLHETGPSQIIPPGEHAEHLTYIFADGKRIYHKGGWTGPMCFKGSDGETPSRDNPKDRPRPPDVHVPNYRGRGGIMGDWVHCMQTRERPFRDIERAHRTATLCHLGNIAYMLGRPLNWDPETETLANDAEASRWLDRPRRAPWSLA